MDALEFEGQLFDALTQQQDDYENGDGAEIEDIQGVYTFPDAGVLTNNKGVVVRMRDGSEFQLTIVKSR